MRKSSAVVIGALAFSAASVALSGCEKKATIYGDVDACSIDVDFGDCDRAYAKAEATWIAENGWPSEPECRLDEDATCTERQDGTWRPAMIGFMLDGEPVEWRRGERCNGVRDECSHGTAVGGGSRGHALYAADDRYLRSAASPTDGVVTEDDAREAAASRASGDAVDRGGLGGSAEGHGSGDGGGGE